MTNFSRRNFLGAMCAVGFALRCPTLAEAAASPKFSLPSLDYGYDALEPHIDAATMKLHHDKHHAAYVKGLNEALAKIPQGHRTGDLEDMLRHIDDLPEALRTAVRNHGGGHWNHSFFWKIIGPPDAKKKISDELNFCIKRDFHDWDTFKMAFEQSAMSRFGSGWAWLVVDKDRNLKIVSTPNQDCPLMDQQTPILGVDVWEHAYYLKYQNLRKDYLTAFWNLVQWDEVSRRFEEARA